MSKSTHWSLDALYSGYQDPHFQNDVQALKELSSRLPSFCEDLQKEKEECILHDGLKKLEEIQDLCYRLKMYTQLMLSVDANNTDNIAWSNNILSMCSSLNLYQSKLWSMILNIENLEEKLQDDKLAKSYSFIIKEKLSKRSHALSDEQEQILSMVYPTSLKAFSDMYYALTGNAKAFYNGQWLPLTQVKNMCHDTSSKVRKEAYEAEQKAYENIAQPLSFAISAIKQQQYKEARLRGYKDPLEKMLIDSRMSEKTLQAMT